MNSYQIVKYSPERQQEWDVFIRNAKNSTFLFERNFMDYHKERFKDFSLLIYRNDKLAAVFPANISEDSVYSHQGLTYGGLVLQKDITFEKTLSIFKKILEYLQETSIKQFIIKVLPDFYHEYPAGEISYLLFLIQAQKTACQLSSTVYIPEKVKTQRRRIYGVKKGIKKGLSIKRTTDFAPFWNQILIPNLARLHDTKPVHTLEEIGLLAQNFPEKILQYDVYDGSRIVGGTTLFVTNKVIHVQYISADRDRQQLGTLDFLFQHLIEEEFADKFYFDFGTSTLSDGKQLNKGLLSWKEGFGARSTVYETYKIDPRNHILLDNIYI